MTYSDNYEIRGIFSYQAVAIEMDGVNVIGMETWSGSLMSDDADVNGPKPLDFSIFGENDVKEVVFYGIRRCQTI